MNKLLQLLRFFSVSFFFVIYGHASIVTPIPIDMNSTVEGTLTSESETSPNSHNASEYYTFTLMEEKNVIISLESDIYHKFYLLDNDGSVIKEVSKYDYRNNKIVMTLAPGSYKIDVTTVFNDEFGSFNISLKENVIETNNITLETILDGEWTSISGISPHSKNYTHYYTFTLSESTDVLIDLESDSPSLYLLDSNNNVIDSVERFGSTHAKIVKTLQAGIYTIDVTNNSHIDTTGIYTLRFKINTIITTEIDLNSTTEGTWSLSSGISPRTKNYTNYYTFTLDEEKDVAIVLDTNISHGEMYLLDSNDTRIDNSYNGDTILAHLPVGRYIIDVSLYNSHTGNFSIQLRENIIVNTSIELNSLIEGMWSSTSGISSRSGAYSNYYTFTLSESKDIVITLPGYNSHFYILNQNGEKIAKHSSFIFYNTLAAHFEAGTYTIDVTQYDKREEGYQLSLYENLIENEVITLNSTIKSKWSSDDGISPYTLGYLKRYTFTLATKTNIIVDLNSSINNKRLYLLNSSNEDDVIYNTGYPNIVTTLDAGTYIIDVAIDSVDMNRTGTFVLNLRENIIEKKPITLNRSIHGNWTNNSGISSDIVGYVNQYTFSLAEITKVTIKMQSPHRKFIRLNDYYGTAYADSSEDLVFSRMLDAGTYIIDVVSADIYQTGDYTLLVQADIIQPLPVNTLTTDVVSSHSTTITWQQGSNSTVGYKIYLNGVFVVDVDALQNNYVFGGLNPESEYEYSVIAYNSAGESEAVGGTFKTKKDDYAWLVPVQYNILN